MWRFSKFYDSHRDAIGVTLITLGMTGALALFIWLTIITKGMALIFVLALIVGGLVIAMLYMIARIIWEEFFE